MFEVDYTIHAPEYGVLNVDADDPEDAEVIALQRLRDSHPESSSIEIEMIRKI